MPWRLPPIELIVIPIETFKQAMHQYPELPMTLLQELSNRLLKVERMVETLSHGDIGSRLERFLLLLCQDFGVASPYGVTIELQLTHQAIAEAIGSTRVTVTRQLRKLAKQNVLSIRQKRITVHQPWQLSMQCA